MPPFRTVSEADGKLLTLGSSLEKPGSEKFWSAATKACRQRAGPRALAAIKKGGLAAALPFCWVDVDIHCPELLDVPVSTNTKV